MEYQLATKVLGIIGGMGPHATVSMFSLVVEMTSANNDQDHLEIFIHNNNKIPDRTKAIFGEGVSPVKELLRSARYLERSGADVIIIPCITSHFSLQDLQPHLKVPIVNAVVETVENIHESNANLQKIGIIATTGTIDSGLFQYAFEKYNISVLNPPPDIQENQVMNGIYGKDGIKAGRNDGIAKERIISAAESLISSGAQAIIAGCTEIPLVLSAEDISVPLIDPMEILATRAIQYCQATVRGDR